MFIYVRMYMHQFINEQITLIQHFEANKVYLTDLKYEFYGIFGALCILIILNGVLNGYFVVKW